MKKKVYRLFLLEFNPHELPARNASLDLCSCGRMTEISSEKPFNPSTMAIMGAYPDS
ncbi:hypothetical protein C8R32_10430 [Nitrosospira sp. Nsp5]|uniref:Uncharacterized protein n=1 Tax=Nitrosospira multiformis TaxID=1231 RepID=A0ABY0TDQ8_9PROT|nr:hypothetical protein C8R32_10430 [Nitrosospira sp. Nsp5]SDQ67652.1 hypothetical protein SAMN05216402_1809 [Nitrosospira multiformis]